MHYHQNATNATKRNFPLNNTRKEVTKMAEAKRNFTRSYSDADRSVTVLNNDGEEVINFKVSEVNGANNVEGSAASAVMRFVADAVVAAGNSAIKAEKDAMAAMQEVLKSLKEGTYTFRTAAGDGGLSIEEEKKIIARTLVEIKYMPDEATALQNVETLFSQVVDGKPGKDGTVPKLRKAYNKLKTVPQIRNALAKAAKEDGSDILAGLGFAKVEDAAE
jgi:hypothetical protein